MSKDLDFAAMKILQPTGWPNPVGYSNGIAAKGYMVLVSGITGRDKDGHFCLTFASQFAQIMENTIAILAEAGATPAHIARMTWYVTNIEEYRQALPELGKLYRFYMGRHYPAMTVVAIDALVERDARLEIETTAIVP